MQIEFIGHHTTFKTVSFYRSPPQMYYLTDAPAVFTQKFWFLWNSFICLKFLKKIQQFNSNNMKVPTDRFQPLLTIGCIQISYCMQTL